MSDKITEADWEFAESHKALGPAYEFAHRVCERQMEAFQDEHMKPLIDEAVKQFQEGLWDAVESHLWSDTEMNLQGKMWRAVDGIVEGILGGRPWVLNRFVLGESYNCEEIRKTLAGYVPRELQDARIADLEAEVERLREQLSWERR